MQVSETLNDGLKRKLSVTIPAADLSARLAVKLDELRARASIKGFRPGKVPMAHLRKLYGKSAMADVMQEAINTSVSETLTERAERAATQPQVDLPGDQTKVNKVLAGEADLDFEVSYEVLPQVQLMDFSTISIERPVVEIDEKDLDKEVQRVFRQNRGYTVKGDDGVVENGDMLGLSFKGTIKGKPFEGGSSDHAHVTVGSGEFIPGFEEQLLGMKKNETRSVEITFPKDYAKEDLAGKKATFETTILHIDGPNPGELDDEFAKRVGLETLEQLRDAVRQQMQGTVAQMSRQAVKRQVLDALDDGHKFSVPEKLVDAEFDGIWQRVTHEIEQHGRSFEDEGTTEETARDDYRKIAERRVRLGLVVAEVGNVNKIEVTEEEHMAALRAEVSRFPGQEQQVFDYYKKNQQALAGLRAPVYENKVVDYVTELAKSSDKPMTIAELSKLVSTEDDGPEEHHHDHDDHDHHDH